MTERAANRKNRVGRVVSDVMDKTVVVTIERRVSHPLYGKSMRRVKRLHAHDEENAYKVGDIVRLVETRPLSKTKRWRVAELLRRDDVLVDVSASPSTALPVAAEALDAEMVAVAAAAAAAADETEVARKNPRRLKRRTRSRRRRKSPRRLKCRTRSRRRRKSPRLQKRRTRPR